jgi:hypothetical protein
MSADDKVVISFDVKYVDLDDLSEKEDQLLKEWQLQVLSYDDLSNLTQWDDSIPSILSYLKSIKAPHETTQDLIRGHIKRMLRFEVIGDAELLNLAYLLAQNVGDTTITKSVDIPYKDLPRYTINGKLFPQPESVDPRQHMGFRYQILRKIAAIKKK